MDENYLTLTLLVISACNPLILAIAYCIKKRFKGSKCCGNEFNAYTPTPSPERDPGTP